MGSDRGKKKGVVPFGCNYTISDRAEEEEPKAVISSRERERNSKVSRGIKKYMNQGKAHNNGRPKILYNQPVTTNMSVISWTLTSAQRSLLISI